MAFKVSAIEVTQQLPSAIFSVRKKGTLSEKVAITEILNLNHTKIALFTNINTQTKQSFALFF